MANKTVTEVVTTTEHALEGFFDIEPNSTEVVKYEQKTELVKSEEYDKKDDEIEEAFQEVYDKAISGYENLNDQIEDIDPKYVARTLEVANQLLGTALSAAQQKADLKKHKDKLSVAKNKNGPNTVNQTLILDTSTLIQQLKNVKPQDIIEVVAEPVSQVEPEKDDSDDADSDEG
jgi:hypothetical protein